MGSGLWEYSFCFFVCELFCVISAFNGISGILVSLVMSFTICLRENYGGLTTKSIPGLIILPSIGILAPFYWIHPHFVWIVLAKILSYTLVPLGFWQVAKNLNQPVERAIALTILVSSAWLLWYKPTVSSLWYEWQPSCLAPPVIVFCFLWLEKRVAKIQLGNAFPVGAQRAHGDCATRIWLLLGFAKKRAVVDRSCSNCSWTDCLILDYLWPNTIFSWESTKLVCTGSRFLGEYSR